MPTVLILVSIYLLIMLEALLLWRLQHQLSEWKKHEELMWKDQIKFNDLATNRMCDTQRLATSCMKEIENAQKRRQ